MAEINKDMLRDKIIRSRELTAMEKRYLEGLIKMDGHAQWFEGGFGDFVCSRCGYCYYGNPKPICPNCGAEMDGGEPHE